VPLNNPPTFNIQQPVASGATPTSAAASNTVASVVAANANRRGLSLWNSGNQTAFIDVANTVSSTNFQFRLEPGGHYELPAPIYTGALFCITGGAGLATTVLTREFIV
jgi:hypothetical protein